MNTPEEKLEAKEARVTELECKLYDADMGWSKQRDRIAALEAELAAMEAVIEAAREVRKYGIGCLPKLRDALAALDAHREGK